MKTLKIDKEDSKVNRQLITKFGQTIYEQDEVRAVSIRVNFKDGSSIAYKRAEDQDLMEKMEKDFEEDEFED